MTRAKDWHTHPCDACGHLVPCGGQLDENHDGHPPVICSAIHLRNGETARVLCEDCLDTETEEHSDD